MFEVEAWGRVASSVIKPNLLVINEMKQYLQVNAEGPSRSNRLRVTAAMEWQCFYGPDIVLLEMGQK